MYHKVISYFNSSKTMYSNSQWSLDLSTIAAVMAITAPPPPLPYSHKPQLGELCAIHFVNILCGLSSMSHIMLGLKLTLLYKGGPNPLVDLYWGI